MKYKYIGEVVDKSYFSYYFNYTDIEIISYGRNDSVYKYQTDCRYHEDDVAQIADQIIANNNWC